MWKKLVSLNLALLMLAALLPVHSAADYDGPKRYANVYRNSTSNDSESKEVKTFYTVTSDSGIYMYPHTYLYQAVRAAKPEFTVSGKVATSYNTKRDGSGAAYALTSSPKDVFTGSESSPAPTLYAQWEDAPDYSILYIGAGVGRSKNDKDYVLDSGHEKDGEVTLKDGDIFAPGLNGRVIEWIQLDNAKKYYPEDTISIDSNLTLVPRVGVNYIIYHYINGKKEESVTTTGSYESNKPIGKEVVTRYANQIYRRDKLMFAGWNSKSDGTGEWFTDYVQGVPHHLFAQYEPYPDNLDYCILYSWLGLSGWEGHEGRMFATHSLTAEKRVGELPVLEKEGYHFLGWFTELNNGTEVTKDSTASFTTTLYAHWEKDGRIIVTFNPNGGTVATTSGTADADGKVTLPTPSRDGYTFEGWYTAAEGGTKLEGNHKFTASTTIYAHWKKIDSSSTDKIYTITFGDKTLNTDADGKVIKLPDTPSRDGYDFDGWFDAETGGNQIKVGDILTGNITLYPHWTKKDDNTSSGDNPSNPDTPNPPSATRYRIYTPGSTPGGSYYVSHSTAAQGTLVTVELSPRRDYALDQLLVTNLDTGRSVSLDRQYSDEYSFIMPASDVEVEISFADIYRSIYYYDFNIPSQAKPGPTAWYYRDRHIYHVTDGQVSDNTLITRDMLLSVLYNLTDDSLIPVESLGSETNAAQVWATSNGIVPDIYASGFWGLDRAATREQAAMLVYGYARYRGYSTYQTANITRYPDYSRVRPIARDAVSWVTATSLMAGSATANLSPQATLTCGQAGDLIYRFETTVAR